jgi:hypothetical protein
VNPKRETDEKDVEGRDKVTRTVEEATREGREDVGTQEDRPRAEDKVNRDKCFA